MTVAGFSALAECEAEAKRATRRIAPAPSLFIDFTSIQTLIRTREAPQPMLHLSRAMRPSASLLEERFIMPLLLDDAKTASPADRREPDSPANLVQNFALRYRSFLDEARSLSFPCDAGGCIDLGLLGDKDMANYLFARALVGRDFAPPLVLPL